MACYLSSLGRHPEPSDARASAGIQGPHAFERLWIPGSLATPAPRNDGYGAEPALFHRNSRSFLPGTTAVPPLAQIAPIG